MRKMYLALGVLTLAGQAQAANLLVNGSFEDGLSSWNTTDVGGNSPQVVISYNTPGAYPVNAYGEVVTPDNLGVSPGGDQVGAKALYFSTDYGNQSVSQAVSLSAGSYDYGFDFYLPANGVANQYGATFKAYLGATLLGSFSASNYGAQTWYRFTGTGTAISSSIFDFTFTADGYPAKDFVIDRVFLTQSATPGVPEAGTWAMMVVGFGAIGAATRRRRTSLTLA